MNPILLTLQNVVTQILMTGDGGGWKLSNLVNNSKTLIGNVGAAICILLGAVMVIMALVKIGTALLSHGKKQTEWTPIIVLLVVGILFIGSAVLIKQKLIGGTIGSEMTNTFQNLGEDTENFDENGAWNIDGGKTE